LVDFFAGWLIAEVVWVVGSVDADSGGRCCLVRINAVSGEVMDFENEYTRFGGRVLGKANGRRLW